MIHIKTSIGIEIRQDDLLVSSLQRNLSGVRFAHFRRIAGYRSREKAEVAREIDQFFKANHLSRDSVVLSIPRKDVVIRYLELPLEVADNLKQVIPYQVQSFEPNEEEKFYFDFVPRKPDPESKKLIVLLVLIKKSLLDAHLTLFRELGIRPAIVTTGSAALSNLFLQGARSSERKTYLIADVSAGGIEVVAVRDGALVFTGDTPRGPAESTKDLLLRALDLAASKTRMGADETIEKIVLSGEESTPAYHELREQLADCALIGEGIPIEMPLANRSHLQEAAVSLGLAHSGLVRKPPVKVNLLPPNLRTRQTPWAYVPAIILGAVCVALLVGLGLQRMIQERILIRKLDQEIAALRGPVKRVQNLRAEAEAAEKKVRAIEATFRQSDLNLEVLRDLTTILPPDTFLTSYSSNNGTGAVTISGLSPSPPDLILKLEQSRFLMNVAPQGPVFKDPPTGKDRFVFQAKLER